MRSADRFQRTTLFGVMLAASALAAPARSAAQTPTSHAVVFEQAGFPSVDTDPIDVAQLRRALGVDTSFADVDQLRSGTALKGANLLVLPYGSAFPADAWPSIQGYLRAGGNLLVAGGQPLRVPVLGDHAGGFTDEGAQDSYSKAIGVRHSYVVPLDAAPTRFHWRHGYTFLPAAEVHASQVYAEEGRLRGLGYLDGADGTHLAAPAIVVDGWPGRQTPPSRIVALPFKPVAGYWATADGETLLRAAAGYAAGGAATLQIEVKHSAVRPDEAPELSAHLYGGLATQEGGEVEVELLADGAVLRQATLDMPAGEHEIAVPFHDTLPKRIYTVRASWTPRGAKAPQESAENGFVVEDLADLETGDALGVRGDFLQLGSRPFLPVGTNYFTTEENGWDFSGPRNDAVWEGDFADMERHGVNFVRTGVWMNRKKFIDPATGAVSERFLRNLEAYLSAAHRHHIAVNFTYFAFTPQTTQDLTAKGDGQAPNPYLDHGAVAAEEAYIASVVQRFRKVPWLCYDLINEPSFSNPKSIFHGNVPNGDAAEVAAWQQWLHGHYANLSALADAWRTTPEDLRDWDAIPLPKAEDLSASRNTDPNEVRAVDYNLFAQRMFSDWVRAMVGTVRAAGSAQLVNVGQDEGGVTDRLLNQFYATAGVAFTTNHTYWQDDDLLWDSVAAKRPGTPNITGETGYQPAWNLDGSWRYDELTGTAIEERKWALGFAAGSSGAMQWDWAREPDFGMQRSDGSAKLWEPMMRSMGDFARRAAPYATGITLPEVAVVLPQSEQLSAHNHQALQAQQTAVRVLFQYDRVEAYAVGEYQMETLGRPKLIVLPSAYSLSDEAWAAIEARVREGAVLLASGPFDDDAHMHPAGRERRAGIHATQEMLQLREERLRWPGGTLPLEYGGMATTVLDRDRLSGGMDYVEVPMGKGKILFSALPLELNGNLDSVAAVYAAALKAAGVGRTYTTTTQNHGVSICPTRLPDATLYVIASETEAAPVAFTDARSGRSFAGRIGAGRAALLLIGGRGELLASYGWEGGR